MPVRCLGCVGLMSAPVETSMKQTTIKIGYCHPYTAGLHARGHCPRDLLGDALQAVGRAGHALARIGSPHAGAAIRLPRTPLQRM